LDRQGALREDRARLGAARNEPVRGAPGRDDGHRRAPDGDRLLLTHYCVARNQPRLVLKESAEDGQLLRFQFLDGTNLPSRDHGHMDKAEYRFVDRDHFTSRWTWYQDGQESWMETIEYRRVR
jgi:hypothetical protein